MNQLRRGSLRVVEEAINSFKSGRPVLIYDWPDRENEVDMVYYAGSITGEKVHRLRTEAGGLVCYGTSEEVVKELGLELIVDVLKPARLTQLFLRNPSYGEKSRLLTWVNSVKTKTGVSDLDKAKTISMLHKVVSLVLEGERDKALHSFLNEFYSPGHVPVLVASGLTRRVGHTDLAVALALLSGLAPSVVFAEMLDRGVSMSRVDAERYAERNGLVIVTGSEITEAWRYWSK